MTLTINKLKRLLNKYPEESIVMVYDGCSYKDIKSVTIEYVDSDDYTQPQINLSTVMQR